MQFEKPRPKRASQAHIQRDIMPHIDSFVLGLSGCGAGSHSGLGDKVQ